MKRILLCCCASLTLITVFTGCSNRDEVASPACEDLKKDLAPAVRADLEKRCPRSGPDFKPSPKKEW